MKNVLARGGLDSLASIPPLFLAVRGAVWEPISQSLCLFGIPVVYTPLIPLRGRPVGLPVWYSVQGGRCVV